MLNGIRIEVTVDGTDSYDYTVDLSGDELSLIYSEGDVDHPIRERIAFATLDEVERVAKAMLTAVQCARTAQSI